jgi:CubicO group peptidase (beta-lactamase class C family)
MGFDKIGLERLHALMEHRVAEGCAPGATWLVSAGGHTEVGAAGTATRDTIFRIASMSKPIAAVAALLLVEECRVRLDDPVDPFLPELADRRVLIDPSGSLEDTVPANRPITLRDLLTFRLGLGMDFTRWGQQPVLDKLGELGLGAGPPQPQGPPATDEWIRLLGSVPLEFQPGERWLYHVGADVLGVLIERVASQPLAEFLHERVFAPLGMNDTAFFVPAAKLDRFGPSYMPRPGGEPLLFDPVDGQWASAPSFPSAGGGLVSTVDDFFSFAEMLRGGGAPLLSRASVELMTTNQLSDDQLTSSSPDVTGALGWGLGLAVQTRRTGLRHVGAYGWDGGLGTSWANDPAEDLVGIVLTNQAFSSPQPPPIVADFWTAAYAALS